MLPFEWITVFSKYIFTIRVCVYVCLGLVVSMLKSAKKKEGEREKARARKKLLFDIIIFFATFTPFNRSGKMVPVWLARIRTLSLTHTHTYAHIHAIVQSFVICYCACIRASSWNKLAQHRMPSECCTPKVSRSSNYILNKLCYIQHMHAAHSCRGVGGGGGTVEIYISRCTQLLRLLPFGQLNNSATYGTQLPLWNREKNSSAARYSTPRHIWSNSRTLLQFFFPFFLRSLCHNPSLSICYHFFMHRFDNYVDLSWFFISLSLSLALYVVPFSDFFPIPTVSKRAKWIISSEKYEIEFELSTVSSCS